MPIEDGSALLDPVPSASAHPAFADEAMAECEPGQMRIGYQPTLHNLVGKLDALLGIDSQTCEGEHWDGQDTVSPGGPSQPCANSTGPTLDVRLTYCLGPDPNHGGADPTAPIRARISGDAAATGPRAEAYAAEDVALVARSASYAGACTDQGSGGLEGSSSCGGSVEVRVATYYRDNIPGNVAWVLVSATGIDQGHADEGDCDQASYQAAAIGGNRGLCGRDNTAVTVGLAVP